MVGAAVFFATAIPRLKINANVDAFLEEDDPGIAVYIEARADWGTDEFAIVCVTADDWFTPEGMTRLRAIEAEVDAIPFVASTMSVLDVPLLRQNPDEKPVLLGVEDRWRQLRARGIAWLGKGMRALKAAGEKLPFLAPLVPEWDPSTLLPESVPESAEFGIAGRMRHLREDGIDLARAGEELTSHELAKGNLISADGRSINILGYLDWSKNAEGKIVPNINVRREKMVDGVRALAARWDKKLGEPVRVSGVPLIQRALYENIRHDLIMFGVAALALFVLAFFLVYRRLRFVIIPVLCCLLPAVGMLGAMALFKIPIALVTSNMPVLLFVLMLPYNVYFIERYRERRALHPEESGFDSTMGALRTIFLPCLFSCATTLAGFVALSTSRIIPIRDFGETMTVGMVVGFVVVFLFLPAAMRRLRGFTVTEGGRESYRPASGLVRVLERATLGRPGWVVAACVVVLVVAVFGARRISAENKFTSYFWPGSEVYEGLEFIDQEVGGTTWIEVLLSSGQPGFFKTREGIRALEVVEAYFADVPETGNIMSLNSLRVEMRKTFTREWFPFIGDAMLLSMINLASPELVGQTTDSRFMASRATIRMKETSPTLHRNRILDGLKAHLAANEEVFAGLEVEITGVFPVYADMLTQLLEGQKQSILVVPLAVYLMLLLLFRSPLLALIVLVPQALPATVLLGIMGWAGIPLDLVTVMIASIAIGVGIDAAIQYTMRFREELAAGHDRRTAVSRSHATIGRAIWRATSIIVAGFCILVLSRFFPTFWFGLFTAAAMLLSQLATLTMLPSLFLLTGYPKPRSVRTGDQERAPVSESGSC